MRGEPIYSIAKKLHSFWVLFLKLRVQINCLPGRCEGPGTGTVVGTSETASTSTIPGSEMLNIIQHQINELSTVITTTHIPWYTIIIANIMRQHRIYISVFTPMKIIGTSTECKTTPTSKQNTISRIII